VRRKRGTKKLICSGCGRHCGEIHDVTERAVRDLPWSGYTATVVVERHRVRCPDCGPKIEKVAQLPSKAPYSKRFEDTVGQACESASARQVARRIGVAESTVRAMDLRYLERWEASRRKPPLQHMGVDELYRGKKDKFLTVVCNLETAEPLWFGKERKKETLDEFFRRQLRSPQRKRIEAACVDMWEPFRLSIEEWAPQCKLVYDKFHIIQHANDAIDEVRRAEFFRQDHLIGRFEQPRPDILVYLQTGVDRNRGQFFGIAHCKLPSCLRAFARTIPALGTQGQNGFREEREDVDGFTHQDHQQN